MRGATTMRRGQLVLALLLMLGTVMTGWLALPAPRPVSAAAGDLLVADMSVPGGLLRVNPLSGNVTPVYNPNGSSVAAVAVAANGDIYLTDQFANSGAPGIVKIDHLTNTPTLIPTPLFPSPALINPFSIAIAPNGNLLVADTNFRVVSVDPTLGTVTPVFPTATSPFAVTVAPNGDIFISDGLALSFTPGIIKVDHLTNAETVLPTQPLDLISLSYSIAVAPNGDILVPDLQLGLRRVTQAGTVTTLLPPPNTASPLAVAVAPNGDFFVTDQAALPGSSPGIDKIDHTTNALTVVPTAVNAMINPINIAVELGPAVTPTATATATGTSTRTPTATATSTATSTPGATATATTTATATSTVTGTPPSTATTTATATVTGTPPVGPTATATATGTTTGAATPTATPTTTGGVVPVGGSGQTAPPGGSLPIPLQVSVNGPAGPIVGANVTFTAPSSGPSCTFPNGSTSITVQTNASGVAQTTCTTNGSTGTFQVVAAVPGSGTTTLGITIATPTPTPVVPELPPFWLFGTGLLALFWRYRRRR